MDNIIMMCSSISLSLFSRPSNIKFLLVNLISSLYYGETFGRRCDVETTLQISFLKCLHSESANRFRFGKMPLTTTAIGFWRCQSLDCGHAGALLWRTFNRKNRLQYFSISGWYFFYVFLVPDANCLSPREFYSCR